MSLKSRWKPAFPKVAVGSDDSPVVDGDALDNGHSPGVYRRVVAVVIAQMPKEGEINQQNDRQSEKMEKGRKWLPSRIFANNADECY